MLAVAHLQTFCVLDAVPNMYLHYLRWWEARKMWGQLLNITRNLVRQVRYNSTDSPASIDSIIIAVSAIAWPFLCSAANQKNTMLLVFTHASPGMIR